MSTTVCVIGTIATDPRTISSPGKATFCTFRLASTERRYDREQSVWVDGDTNWYTITVFRGLAEHAAASFAKGERVIVNGRLRVRRWESDDKSGTTVEVEADAIGHELRWGVSAFTKRSGSESGAEASTPASAFGSPADQSAPSGWAPAAASEAGPAAGDAGFSSGIAEPAAAENGPVGTTAGPSVAASDQHTPELRVPSAA